MQHKKCTKCGEEKPATLEYFHRKTKTKDGLQYSCKQCNKAYNEANKESLKEYSKAHNRTPKGKYTKIKRGAKVREINFAVPFQIYESKLWGEPCHYCGVDIEVTGLDRKDSNKGYTPDNVVPCCYDCNRKKSTKPYEQFLEEIKKNTCIS